MVRSELPPRFGAPKAPLGDQGELSAKLTERIRTLLFRLYQRRNVAGRRIRLLRIRIGTVKIATPLLHNSSVAFGDSSFYTKEPLDGANAQYLKNFRSPPHPALRATFPSRGRLWAQHNALALPLGELSAKLTERVYTYPLRPSLRSATSPIGGGKGGRACVTKGEACASPLLTIAFRT